MAEITLRGVEKSFSGRAVLRGVDLDIQPGTAFALLGPNGCGKTTLVRCITTLLAPDAGEIRVAGCDAVRDPRRARSLIGCALDGERAFFQRLSGRENLRFFAALHGFGAGEGARRAGPLLESVGLAASAGRRVMEYSTGMKQKLALVRALLPDPPVLILDEPTRGLDPLSAAGFRAALRALVHDLRRTLLLVTHNLEEAAELGDRAAILSSGHLHLIEDTSHEAVAAAYRRWAVEESA